MSAIQQLMASSSGSAPPECLYGRPEQAAVIGTPSHRLQTVLNWLLLRTVRKFIHQPTQARPGTTEKAAAVGLRSHHLQTALNWLLLCTVSKFIQECLDMQYAPTQRLQNHTESMSIISQLILSQSGGCSGVSTTGGRGVVRIIWGAGRAFPSTNTGIVGTETTY